MFDQISSYYPSKLTKVQVMPVNIIHDTPEPEDQATANSVEEEILPSSKRCWIKVQATISN
jgi:hypothetical protein